MSTKETIASGPNFRLYRELLDEDSVYLELEGQPFEASHQHVTVFYSCAYLGGHSPLPRQRPGLCRCENDRLTRRHELGVLGGVLPPGE